MLTHTQRCRGTCDIHITHYVSHDERFSALDMVCTSEIEIGNFQKIRKSDKLDLEDPIFQKTNSDQATLNSPSYGLRPNNGRPYDVMPFFDQFLIVYYHHW